MSRTSLYLLRHPQVRVDRDSPGVEHRVQFSLRLNVHVHHGSDYRLWWNVHQTWHSFPHRPNSRALQDDADKQIQWRMHTNANVSIDKSIAALTLQDKTMHRHASIRTALGIAIISPTPTATPSTDETTVRS